MPSRRLVVIAAWAGVAVALIAGSVTAFAIWSSRHAPRVALHPTASSSSYLGNPFGVIRTDSPSASPTSPQASTSPSAPEPSVSPTAPGPSISPTEPANAGSAPPLPASSTPNPNQAMIGMDVDGRPLLASVENWPGRSTTAMTTTWKWDGLRWNALRSDLPVAVGSAMAYESHLRKMVQLAGGITGIPYTMWGWDSSGWAELHPAAMPSRGLDLALLAADWPRHQLLALIPETTETSSTWTFDGVTWTRVATAINPPARRRAGLTYYNDNSTLVLYGGDRIISGSAPLDDTWAWDGTSWTQLHPATSPGGCAAQLAYDAAISQLLLLCQRSAGDTMWSWTGTTWTQLHPTAVPLPAYEPYMTYDAIRGELVFFSRPLNSTSTQTWTYANGQWKRVT